MLSALIYAEEDSKRENERRVAEVVARGCETEAGTGWYRREEGQRERERERDREDHRSCRIRSHVIGIVDSVLHLSALWRNLSSHILRFQSHSSNPCFSLSLSLSFSLSTAIRLHHPHPVAWIRGRTAARTPYNYRMAGNSNALARF